MKDGLNMKDIAKDYINASKNRGMTDDQIANLYGFKEFMEARIAFLNKCLNNDEFASRIYDMAKGA